MRKSTFSVLGVLTLGTFVAIGQCSATTIITTDYTTWKGGLTGSASEVGFDQLALGTSFNTFAGTTQAGFSFTGPDNGSYKLSVQQYNFGSFSQRSLVGSTDSGAGINVTMPSGGENALFLFANGTVNTPLTLLLSDGQSFSISSGNFGIRLSHTISSFSLSTTAGSAVAIRDLDWGTSALPQDLAGSPIPTATPEAATLTLFGLGLFLLSTCMRVFKKRACKLAVIH
jgi:hypothetical protein